MQQSCILILLGICRRQDYIEIILYVTYLHILFLSLGQRFNRSCTAGCIPNSACNTIGACDCNQGFFLQADPEQCIG